MENKMLKSNKPARRAKTSPRWTRYKTLLLGGAGLLGILAGVVTHTKEIVTAIQGVFPAEAKPDLRLGWLTIKEPEVFNACGLRTGGTFKLGNGTLVSLSDNDCYQALNKRLDAQAAPDAMQTVGQSVFLLVENQGGPIEYLRFVSDADPKRHDDRQLRPIKNTAIAYCVNFQGKGGVEGYSSTVSAVVVKRTNAQPLRVDAPPRTGVIPSGASDCSANMVYAYPQL